MPSRIDPSKPPDRAPASKADLRANLAAAKAELEHGGFFKSSAPGAVERTTAEALADVHVSARDFGAVSDDATDNSAALIAMRDFMLQDPTKHYRIFFPPGLYRYSNNRWLLGLRRFEVVAYGAAFQCTALHSEIDPGAEADIRTFGLHLPFEGHGDQVWPGWDNARVDGRLFSSAVAGSSTITLLDPADAPLFPPGTRALLYGYSQQESGTPPNPRFFEWKAVVASDEVTGALTFTEALRHDYDDRWWDDAEYLVWGKPRILALDRSDYNYVELAIFRGCTILETPEGRGYYQIGADTWIAEDCRIEASFSPACARLVITRNCTSPREHEFDKIVDRIIVDGGRWGDGRKSFNGATGINDVTIRDADLHGDLELSPRRLHVEGCRVVARNPAGATNPNAVRAYVAVWPTRAVTVERTTIYDHAPPGALRAAISNKYMQDLKVASVGPNREIRLIANADGLQRARGLPLGGNIATGDGSNAGRITAVYVESGEAVIEGDWPNAPTPGEVYYWDAWPLLSALGSEVQGGDGTVPVVEEPLRVGAGRRTVALPAWTPVRENVYLQLHARLLAVDVDVRRAYTGQHAEAFLQFKVTGTPGRPDVYLGRIDLKQTGLRRVTPFAAHGARGADELVSGALPLGGVALERWPFGDGGRMFTGAEHEMPQVALTLEIEP